jgi:hypothetical protein
VGTRERIRDVAIRIASPDDPDSFAGRARARRWTEFEERFPEVSEMRVLDLGGTPRYWRAAPVRPTHVTILNLIPEVADEDWIDSRDGDATVKREGESFDLVVSNSLIEHLPDDRRKAFAEVVEGAAPRHWIQTPNKHFPIEPHWLFPGAQYMGRPARGWLARNWPASHLAELPPDLVESEVQNIRLLTPGDLAELFPQSEIWHERVGPLTKSLVALKA